MKYTVKVGSVVVGNVDVRDAQVDVELTPEELLGMMSSYKDIVDEVMKAAQQKPSRDYKDYPLN